MIVQGREVADFVCQRTESAFWGGEAIGWSREGRIVAGFLYTRYNGSSIAMHVAFDVKHVGRQFLRAAFDYPFNHLAVHKVIAVIDSSNEKSHRFAEHCGCVLEHRIEGAGKPDLLILTMTKEQCRFL